MEHITILIIVAWSFSLIGLCVYKENRSQKRLKASEKRRTQIASLLEDAEELMYKHLDKETMQPYFHKKNQVNNE